MYQSQLNQIEEIFSNFAKSFFNSDSFVNSNLDMKLCHSYHVRKESAYIAKKLNLSPKNAFLAETIGLLHDIGRFPQFAKYRTYVDKKSVNHCKLGVDSLEESGVIRNLPEDEQEIIRQAILYHGEKDIPAEFEGDFLLQTQIIRDADKIDIFRVLSHGYKMLYTQPENFKYELEYPDNGKYTLDILKKVMAGEKIDYNHVKTLDDNKLLQLAWIFDINFAPSLDLIVQRGYISELIGYLPKNAEIAALQGQIMEYIHQKTQ